MPTSTLFNFRDPTLMIVPWDDPVVDQVGHDVRGHYVEVFWLNVLGPTATWTLRRLVAGLDRYALGYELDLDETAGALGLSYSSGTSNTFGRALHRCVMFGVAQPVPDGLAVRRRLPTVSLRQLDRMPERLRVLHTQWRAGDVVEPQLLAAGVTPDTSSAA